MYNEPPFFDAVFSIFSALMKDKMKSRVSFVTALSANGNALRYEAIDPAAG